MLQHIEELHHSVIEEDYQERMFKINISMHVLFIDIQ